MTAKEETGKEAVTLVTGRYLVTKVVNGTRGLLNVRKTVIIAIHTIISVVP